jgi:hypothetical protein
MIVFLVDSFEHFLCFRIAGILIRVILEGESAILLFDLLVGGRLGDVQQLVQRGTGPTTPSDDTEAGCSSTKFLPVLRIRPEPELLLVN